MDCLSVYLSVCHPSLAPSVLHSHGPQPWRLTPRASMVRLPYSPPLTCLQLVIIVVDKFKVVVQQNILFFIFMFLGSGLT